VRGAGMSLVGGDDLLARLLETAREPSCAGEQIVPKRLSARVGDARHRRERPAVVMP
jgi:hypothetical protein